MSSLTRLIQLTQKSGTLTATVDDRVTSNRKVRSLARILLIFQGARGQCHRSVRLEQDAGT